MRKLLFLLPFFLQACAEQNYSQIKIPREVHGANIEMLVPYKHPRAKKVGEMMPLAIGKPTYYMDMYSSNKVKEDAGLIICYDRDRDKETIGAVKYAGRITGYDRDGDEDIAEYEFIRRYCDVGSDVETYAVFDIPNELIYVDSSRDKYIDAIVECRDIDSLESAVLYMKPTECEENKAKKVSKLGGK